MITEGAQNFYQWWIAAAPGIAILTVVLAFNFVGDGLRDTFDVRDVAMTEPVLHRSRRPARSDVRHFSAGPARAAVRGVDLDVLPGEALAVVGESGSGKSVTMLATARASSGRARSAGRRCTGGTELVGRDRGAAAHHPWRQDRR